MRILIDTNVIIDFFQNREPHCDNAQKIINSCITRKNEGYISAHSLADLFFILRKDKSVAERKSIILNLCKFFKIIPEEKGHFVSVCNKQDWNDLEDGLQMVCADTEMMDYIVSRDIGNGFKNSPVRIICPEDFLRT